MAEIIDVSFDIEKIKAQLNVLESEFNKVKDRLEKGGEAVGKTLQSSTERGAEAMKDVKKEADVAAQSITNLSKGGKQAGDSIEKGAKRGFTGMKSVKKETDIAAQSMTKLTSSVKKLAVQFGLAFTAASAIRNAATIITNFENANANLNATLGKTREETAKLREQQLSLGASTKFTASQVADAQLELGKLGQTLPEITRTTPGVLALASAIGVDLATAATIVSQTLNQFGLDAGKATEVVDIMTKSFSSSALDLEKFSAGMRVVGPVASQFGITLERTTAILGVLANNGIRAETAATALRNILLQSNKAGLSYEQAIQRIAESADKTATAMNLFGVEGASVAVILSNTTAQVEELDKTLQNAAGTSQEMADKQLQTLTAKITILQSAWEGLILSIENGEGAISRASKTIVENITGILGDLRLMNEITGRTNASFISFFFDFDNGALKAAYSINIWKDSAKEAMAANNWRGARADIDALEEMRKKYSENSTEGKYLASVLAELTKEYNTMLAALIQVGVNDPSKVITTETVNRKGLVESLKEQKKATEELLEKAGSQGEVNKLLDRREKLETRINQILNQRANIIALLAEKETRMLDDTASAQVARMQQEDAMNAQKKSSIDALFDAEIDAYAEKTLKQLEWDRFRTEQSINLERARVDTTLEILSYFNDAAAILASENAERAKVFAVFSALIDAALAILAVLRDSSIPTTARIPLSIAIGIKSAALVAKIVSTPVPSFFEGTDYLKRNGAPIGKDTIPIMAHEGEAIIPTAVNKAYPGLTKSLIKGDFDRYVQVKHVMPQLKAQKAAMQAEQASLIAQVLKGTVMAQLNDDRIVNELKRGRHVNEDVAHLLAKATGRRNPYRA